MMRSLSRQRAAASSLVKSRGPPNQYVVRYGAYPPTQSDRCTPALARNSVGATYRRPMSTSPLETCSGRWSRSYHLLYSSVHHAGMSSMASSIPLASMGSVRHLDGDGGPSRGELGAALLLG